MMKRKSLTRLLLLILIFSLAAALAFVFIAPDQIPSVLSDANPTAEVTTHPDEAGSTPDSTDGMNQVTSEPVGPVYDNPVYQSDFPDPFVLRVDDTYYAFSTNAGTVNVPTITSDDLMDWRFVGDALPALPDWAAVSQSLTWAPGVLARGETFVLYYTARYVEAGRQCISRAISDKPDGPYEDNSVEPFICQTDLGGSIDPYPFVDKDGTPYLLWKNDGNCCGITTGLWIQQLSEDGLSLIGEPTELVERDQAWERPLIENPAMWEHNGDYYLFYSGNWWESHEYAVGYAVCETITGPCDKPQHEPIFSFTPEVMGPGGEALFTDEEGNLWLAYHAWTGPDVGYPGGARSFRIDPVTFEDGKPVIHGPSTEPQPLP